MRNRIDGEYFLQVDNGRGNCSSPPLTYSLRRVQHGDACTMNYESKQNLTSRFSRRLLCIFPFVVLLDGSEIIERIGTKSP